MTQQEYCPLKNSECTIKSKVIGKKSAITSFIAIPYKEEMTTTTATIAKVLQKYGIENYIAKGEVTAGREILCKICQRIRSCDFGIVEATYINPNVMLEFGMLLGQRKPVFLLFDNSRTRNYRLPSDIIGLERIQYKNQETLCEKLDKGIEGFIQQFNVDERIISNLIEMTLYYVKKKDLSSVDSLLQTIYEKSDTDLKRSEDFVELLEKVIMEFIYQKDLATALRFGLAGVRVFFQKKENKKAMLFYDKVMVRLRDSAFVTEDEADKLFSSLSNFRGLSNDPLEFLEFWNENFTIKDFKNPEVANFFYASLWDGLYKSNDPRKLMKKWTQEIVEFLMPANILPWYDYVRTPWLGYFNDKIFLILWLESVFSKYGRGKKVVQIVNDALYEIRRSLEEFTTQTFQGSEVDGFDEYIEPARSLKGILEHSVDDDNKKEPV